MDECIDSMSSVCMDVLILTTVNHSFIHSFAFHLVFDVAFLCRERVCFEGVRVCLKGGVFLKYVVLFGGRVSC